MKKTIALNFVWIAAVFVLASCESNLSIRPLYTSKTDPAITEMPGLEGKWRPADKSHKLEIEKEAATKDQALHYEFEFKKLFKHEQEFVATVLIMNGTFFLDVTPDPEEAEYSKKKTLGYEPGMYPVHLIFKAELKGDRLLLFPLKLSKYKESASEQSPTNRTPSSEMPKDTLPYVVGEGGPVITASSEQIQAYLKKYAAKKSLYGDSIVYFKR